ncbi:glycoside hydrolase family 31 protein [Fulvivirgaceae bacterium BMA12]|uniref:Glycoside hydrolase family 31 protein n=1 Tax=Agaribacillus aureus TaxID=3051825 RepID=A0ABT8LAM8_9BACT|nr:glycoside hydrolase family 31 protein [Fulvivirgaceae bacterium BMA12]
MKINAMWLLLACWFAAFGCSSKQDRANDQQVPALKGAQARLFVEKKGFRYDFRKLDGTPLVPAHPVSGIVFMGSEVVSSEEIEQTAGNVDKKVFLVTNATGDKARVEVSFINNLATFKIIPQAKGLVTISLRLGGMPLAHGLGDAGAYGESFNLIENKASEYPIENNGGIQRWASTFTIFPKNSLAGVFFDDGKKTVVLSASEYEMNITRAGGATFHYLLGDPAAIYKSYKKLRTLAGYKDVQPKPRFFELGWESWDALGWNTNQKTVQAILQKFHHHGYPIRWAVTGSGFWETGGTTTSFGRWGEKFPNPQVFKTWMHQHDIKWLIGLRTNFVPAGGPFYPVTEKRDKNLVVKAFNGNDLSVEAKEKGFLVKHADGEALKITSNIFPIVPSYLLDGNTPGAALWYEDLFRKWEVDGIKEDTMMDIDSLTDIFNLPMIEIARKGGLVMARNGEFIAPGTLLRVNDTNVGQITKRIPINYLQYAACGFPNVYSDVAGVHNMHRVEDADRSVRHTWLLALTSGLAVGAYPDKWPVEKKQAFKEAIDFHASMVPYMYSAAMNGYENGYPYTLTPITIAFPGDSTVAKLAHFQWMIGGSLMAAPLLKNHTSNKMDVYLPTGIWFDYEGKDKYMGPVMLEDIDVPLDRIPCFIGGKGILIERKNNQLLGRIYPVAKKAKETFIGLDGETQNIITIDNPDWENFKIVDTITGQEVSFTSVHHTFQFEIISGHNYLIK